MAGPTAHFSRCSLHQEMCTSNSLRHNHILHLASLLPTAAILTDRCPVTTMSRMHHPRTFLERQVVLAKVIPAGMDELFRPPRYLSPLKSRELTVVFSPSMARSFPPHTAATLPEQPLMTS